jgi:hypothetical protein
MGGRRYYDMRGDFPWSVNSAKRVLKKGIISHLEDLPFKYESV